VEAEIRKSFPDIEVELEEGRTGVFNVSLDGKTIFWRIPFIRNFPSEGEITENIRKRIGK